MVIANRELPELLGEAASAGIVNAAHAPAVTSPVAERVDNSVKQRIVGVYRAPLTHCHMMWRIERTCAEVAYSARLADFAGNLVGRAERVAVVLDEP